MIFISAGLSVFNLVLFVRLSPSVMAVVRFYSDEVVNGRALQRAAKLCPQLSVSTELCYNVELTGERPTACHVIIILIVRVRSFEHFAVSYTNPLCHVVVSSCFLRQAPRVSAPSKRRFSSGCFALHCRRSRCRKNQSSPRDPAANWWRSGPGTAETLYTV